MLLFTLSHLILILLIGKTHMHSLFLSPLLLLPLSFSLFYSLKMEVGIEDCLHIEFEYNKSKFVYILENIRVDPHHVSSLSLFLRYHLRDVVVGKIYFLLVRIKIKHMEIAIIKKETTGTRKPHPLHDLCF